MTPPSALPHPSEKERTHTRFQIIGLAGGSRGWAIADLSPHHKKICVVCRDQNAAEALRDDIRFFLREVPIALLPAWDILPFEQVSPQIDIIAERSHARHLLHTGERAIIITTPAALLQKNLPWHTLSSLQFSLTSGDTANREQVATATIHAGYQESALVEEVGQVATRGQVIDIFPPGYSEPIRMEFRGNRVHLKHFDAETQRSTSECRAACILPVREVAPLQNGTLPADLPLMLAAVRERAKELGTPPSEVSKICAALERGDPFPGIENLQPFSTPFDALLDEAISHTTLVLSDPAGIEHNAHLISETISERAQRMANDHYLLPEADKLYLEADALIQSLRSEGQIILDSLVIEESNRDSTFIPTQIENFQAQANSELSVKLKTKIGTGNAFRPLGEIVDHSRRQGDHIAFVVGSSVRAERLSRILLDLNMDARVLPLSGSEWVHSPRRYPLVILQGHLSAGFQLPHRNLIFIGEDEIFAERSFRTRAKRKVSLKRIMSTLSHLSDGDYVVHVDFGIGRYKGLTHLDVREGESDFLHIQYADSQLYLPVHNIGKLQKFVAAEGQAPKIDKLGSNRWVKTKQRVRDSVATLAADLIKLYATRNVVKGWRFEPWGAEDERFADDFAYTETPDQAKAIQETVNDMAKERPMDRLVCGDVGFGKTEVALRAAFKCVQHTRQVAVLCPTTILVEQHRATFERRFKGYPVSVGALSRFYKPVKNRETVTKIESGDLDIVIGTHKLLSRQVQFKDLGLVIVDEEHRFGVKQKEALKQLKKQVDVLTLTATPIPRTLHMSLLEIRDISVISTPPQDRRVIKTYLARSDDTLIRDAVMREIQRGGQCFYIHNRVDSIAHITAHLSGLIPEARFEFAHGQMSEQALERIMVRFLNHEFDVLVSTTIVESGIDIPNANTIIIERAENFGLAQLYQMRGRVGRASVQAYCYFLIPRMDRLSDDAQKRLQALQSLDELGLGFNLALRDMEIRGAGNLLGKEQSGSVLAVGFELYSKILKEAVLHLKGEDLDDFEEVDPEIKIGVSAFIPRDYIPDVSERLIMYQRLAAASSDLELDQLCEEIEDRFGPARAEVSEFIDLMRFRSLLRRYGVVRAEAQASKILLTFSQRSPIDPSKIIKLVTSDPKQYHFTKSNIFSWHHQLGASYSPNEVYREASEVLARIGVV